MRKIVIWVLGVSLLFACAACSPKDKENEVEGVRPETVIGEQGGWNMFSTIADLSDITWYLTQNYGNTAPESYHYYEFWDAEIYYILVELEEARGDTGGTYLVFPYNRGMSDWYRYRYDPITDVSVENTGKTPENEAIFKLAFTLYGDDETYELYISCLENGRVRKAWPGSSYVFEYTYGQAGELDCLRMAGCSDFYNAFFTDGGDELKYYFDYNQDGSLNTISAWDEDMNQLVIGYQYEYTDGMRIKVTDWEENFTSYVRDENGRVKTADAFDCVKDSDFIAYAISYDAGGATTVQQIDG